MEKGKLLGKGMTAEVYEWGPDRVLKLYFEKFGEDWVRYEADIGAAVHQAGVPSPAVHDLVEINGRRGVVFERISGKSILSNIYKEPWMVYNYAKQLADLHCRINRQSAEILPSQFERFTFKINTAPVLSEQKKKRILDYVESLPDGGSVCHGDLHFGNVIVSDRGLVPVDWRNAYHGNPLSDVARTCLMITSPATSEGIPDFGAAFLQYPKSLIYWTYLSRYMMLSKARFTDMDEWILPAAAAKLRDNIPGEQKWLMSIINTRLELLNTGH